MAAVLTVNPHFLSLNTSNDEFCVWASKFFTVAHHTTKSMIYLIFILRIKMAFDQSAFKYSNTVIYSYFSVLFCFIITFLIGDLFFTGGEWQHNSSDVSKCRPIYPPWGGFLTGIFDIILSFIPLYLFIKPLYIMSQNDDLTQTRNFFFLSLRKCEIHFFFVKPFEP